MPRLAKGVQEPTKQTVIAASWEPLEWRSASSGEMPMPQTRSVFIKYR